MRRVLHLLLVLTVIWCGSHLCEPAQAQGRDADFSLRLDAHMAPDQDDGADKGSGKLAHGHHHCPIASDLHAASDLSVRPVARLIFAPSGAALSSLSHAPPLQPPSA